MALTLGELARRFGGEVRGDSDIAIRRVAPLDRAQAGEISYLADLAYAGQLATTKAAAVILPRKRTPDFGGNAWIVDNPRASFARAATLLHPPDYAPAGIHPSASVDPAARVSEDAHIGPLTTVEEGAVVEAGAVIGPGCVIGRRAHVGEGTRLIAQVAVNADCILGRRCIVHSGAVIGSDGFGFAPENGQWVKIPQLGRVVIGDDVEIGANTSIDRGALDDTVIGNGVKIDNLVHIAHNVRIGDDTALAGFVGIAGSAIVGKRCTVGGQSGIVGHITVGDDVHLMGRSLLSHDTTEPGVYSSALPALPVSEWNRNAARLRHLDDLARRVKALEKQIQQMLQGKES